MGTRATGSIATGFSLVNNAGLHTDPSTAAESESTGSLQCSGGCGVAADLYTGGILCNMWTGDDTGFSHGWIADRRESGRLSF